MNEYTIVTVVIVLVGFVITVCTPIVKNTKEAAQRTIENTKAMTELTMTLKSLAERIGILEANNVEAHREIVDKQEVQQNMLNNHEYRIGIIEHDLTRQMSHADDLK